jgi:hypothetical protein
MGFNTTANTITITAQLTKAGRERLLEESNSILSHFIIGDSDANYQTNKNLSTGLIPTNSGDLGEAGGSNNNIAEGISVKNKVYLSDTTLTRKATEAGSFQLRGEVVSLGETTVSGSNLTFLTIDKTQTIEEKTNYFKSLDLPLTNARKSLFTSTLADNGGWLDTAFSGLNSDTVLMAIIDNADYGELIDGKSIKGVLPIATGFTTGGTVTGITTHTFYSTFISSGQFAKTALDRKYEDESVYTQGLFNGGVNVAYIVSDDIQRPNSETGKTWSTGYDTFKPFSNQNKELIRMITVPNNNVTADNVIGIAYLDKGIIAFTNPTFVTGVTSAFNFTGDTDTTTISNNVNHSYMTGSSFNVVTDSIINNLVQNVVCVAGRGEFYRTTNDTWVQGDDVRISEIAISDISGEILAVGKPDRHIVKKKNDFVIFDVQIII